MAGAVQLRKASMPGYSTLLHEVAIAGAAPLHVRALSNRQQYADPQGQAMAAGVSSAQWPLFGLLWPAGLHLAREMAQRVLVPGHAILEIGCGLGLASLVSHRRGALVTASDCHPLAGAFLLENLRLNALAPMRYCHGDWSTRALPGFRPPAPPVSGCFELIIGSDVLYERDEAGTLAGFIARHAAAAGEVLIVDPNRGHRAVFVRHMRSLGYAFAQTLLQEQAGGPCTARLLCFTRA